MGKERLGGKAISPSTTRLVGPALETLGDSKLPAAEPRIIRPQGPIQLEIAIILIIL